MTEPSTVDTSHIRDADGNVQRITAIAAAYNVTCIITHSAAQDAAELRCWGDNRYKQCAASADMFVSTPPTQPLMTEVLSVSIGYDHVCAVSVGHSLHCWGGNMFGQVGVPDDANATVIPPGRHNAAVLQGVASVSAGRYYTCAIMMESQGLRCWGVQLGSPRLTLGTVQPSDWVKGVASIAAGATLVCVTLQSSPNVIRCAHTNH